MQQLHRHILTLACLLSAVVILWGGYTRLMDAGLGCPDWPGCYGHWQVPTAQEAQIAYPDYEMAIEKAYPEMHHRYIAGTLGLLIGFLCIDAWRRGQHRKVATALLFLVIFQALLGKWTVTWKLFPPVVMGHLLGGTCIIALLWGWRCALAAPARILVPTHLQTAIRLCTALVFCQIALGGWTSANYAALACNGFPTCNGLWFPPMEWHAFDLTAGWNHSFPPEARTFADRITIHMVHRIGALVVTLAIGALVFALRHHPALRRWVFELPTILLVQISLGITNVLALLPTGIAMAHQGVAIFLLLTLLSLNQRVRA